MLLLSICEQVRVTNRGRNHIRDLKSTEKRTFKKTLKMFLSLPFCTDVLVLNGHTRHLPHPDAHLDVSEFQTQVFAQDGQPGAPLAGPRLREQLDLGNNGHQKR